MHSKLLQASYALYRYANVEQASLQAELGTRCTAKGVLVETHALGSRYKATRFMLSPRFTVDLLWKPKG